MPTLASVHSSDWPGSADSPVAILMHGFGSHERDLAGLAPFLPRSLPWASLRGPLEMGYGGAAWFPLTPDGAMDDAQIRAAADAVWAWVDEHVDPGSAVVPLGFSQGGLMALQLLRTRPARVLAPVVLSGFVQREEQEHDDDLARSRPEVFWGRGDADPVVWPDAVARTASFMDAHTTATTRVYPGLGHSVSERELTEVRAFLAPRV